MSAPRAGGRNLPLFRMAVAKAASAAGFGIGIVDDREAFANAERFPMAARLPALAKWAYHFGQFNGTAPHVGGLLEHVDR